METQFSNIFLSVWNQHENKPLGSGPRRIPEQEATLKLEANDDIEGQEIEPIFPLNIESKHMRGKQLSHVAGWAVLNNLSKSNA